MAKNPDSYDFYLAGAVCHDPDGIEWREKVEKALPMFSFYNPLREEKKATKENVRALLESLRIEADTGDIVALENLKGLMWDIVIPNDMAGVTSAKALIAYIKKGVRACGTFIEMYEAFIMQGKPVYLISELSYTEMNNWEIAISSIIFRSVDELVGYFKEAINQAKIERLRSA
jgi:hypothetical protein